MSVKCGNTIFVRIVRRLENILRGPVRVNVTVLERLSLAKQKAPRAKDNTAGVSLRWIVCFIDFVLMTHI